MEHTESINESIEKKQNEQYFGNCPSCKEGKIVDKKKFYGCSKYKDGCKQTIPKLLLDKSISEAQIKKLLTKGKTDKITGFKGKKGKFDSVLSLEKDKKNNTYSLKLNFK